MLRKHTIMMNKNELENDAQFYSWECITLSFKKKLDVYLIIKSEQIMSDFLKLLILKTETRDGRRGSALLQKMMFLKKA